MPPLKIIAACLSLCTVFTSSCAHYRGVFASAYPAPGTRVDWPGVRFKEVRAYCYDYTAEEQKSFYVDGRMHRGVMDPKGVKLSSLQVKRLLDAVTISQAKQSRTACYAPHHAFVYFDGSGNPVAVFEMCFGCNKFVATPQGVPEYVNYDELWRLTSDLGLPLGRGNAFYTDACRRGHSLH